jgi:hypothetical protein
MTPPVQREPQDAVIRAIRDAICRGVEVSDVNGHDGVKRVETPFIDWKGEAVTVYVRPNGEVTDGASSLNQLSARRAFDDYLDWPFREDYLLRFAIAEKGRSLIAAQPAEAGAVLRYIQGIARLGSFFQSAPIKDRADIFPSVVRSHVKDWLATHRPPNTDTREWEEERLKEKSWAYDGLPLTSDFTPLDQNVMVQIISNSTASPTVQKQHVSHKIMPFLLMRERRQHLSFVPVVNSLRLYPSDARKLLQNKAREVVQVQDFEDNDAVRRLGEVLTRHAPFENR